MSTATPALSLPPLVTWPRSDVTTGLAALPRRTFDGVTPSAANPGDSGTSKSVANLDIGSDADVEELVTDLTAWACAIPATNARTIAIGETRCGLGIVLSDQRVWN